MDLLIKGIDTDFEIQKKNLAWTDAFQIMEDTSFDIKYGKQKGSLFVFKLNADASILYETGTGDKEMISTDLYYRMQRRNPELIKKIKSITGE